MGMYTTNTVQIKTGSASVKGNNTNFVTYASQGYLFKLTSESSWYDIGTIQNATNLTLTSRYANSNYQTSRTSENVATITNATKSSSGTLNHYPVIQEYVRINASEEIFTDDGGGVLTGNASPAGSGTVDYDTGAWSITLGTDLTATYVVITASYYSGDTRTGLSYQIVTDYTPNQSYPEMSINDVNFPHIFTKALRMIDGDIYIPVDYLKNTIVDQGSATLTSCVLDTTDFNKVHNFTNTATCVVTIPEGNSSYKGSWVQCRKKGSGELDLVRAGSNTIMNATHVKCTATNTWSFIDLILDTATNFGCQGILGDWTTS